MGYLMQKLSLWKKLYYLTNSLEDKGVHTFPEGISPKVNTIILLELELAYFKTTVQHFSHYTMVTSSNK